MYVSILQKQQERRDRDNLEESVLVIMMRFTIIILAFLIITQALEEDHILEFLVYAHQGGDACHKSFDYRGDKDASTLHPKEMYDFTNIGAPRKLRSGRTTRTKVARAEKEQVMATNNHNWSLKFSGASKHLMLERKLGFHKRSKISSFKWKPKKKKFSSAKDMKKLARLLHNDYPIHSKPRRKPPINNRTPDKI